MNDFRVVFSEISPKGVYVSLEVSRDRGPWRLFKFFDTSASGLFVQFQKKDDPSYLFEQSLKTTVFCLQDWITKNNADLQNNLNNEDSILTQLATLFPHIPIRD